MITMFLSFKLIYVFAKIRTHYVYCAVYSSDSVNCKFDGAE